MNTITTERRVWRLYQVTWTHRMGSIAPKQELWAQTKKEANVAARTMSRLADFPKTWSFKLQDITDQMTEKERKRGIR